jgi:hypothetical protein
MSGLGRLPRVSIRGLHDAIMDIIANRVNMINNNLGDRKILASIVELILIISGLLYSAISISIIPVDKYKDFLFTKICLIGVYISSKLLEIAW